MAVRAARQATFQALVVGVVDELKGRTTRANA